MVFVMPLLECLSHSLSQARDGRGNNKITASASFDPYLTLTERQPTPVGPTRNERDSNEEVKVYVNLTFVNIESI